MHHRSFTLTAAAAVAILTLAACGDGDGDASTTDTKPSAPEGGVTLTISGRAFSAVTATAGEPIAIVNSDGFSHTVTDREGAFDVKVAGSETGTLTIETAGIYKVFCTIHPDMAGTVTVD
ncbi:MAG: cupredoxin domain-containing protein [Ilumatobacteraceae bacterium]